jgi:hypothetical protein
LMRFFRKSSVHLLSYSFYELTTQQ